MLSVIRLLPAKAENSELNMYSYT